MKITKKQMAYAIAFAGVRDAEGNRAFSREDYTSEFHRIFKNCSRYKNERLDEIYLDEIADFNNNAFLRGLEVARVFADSYAKSL